MNTDYLQKLMSNYLKQLRSGNLEKARAIATVLYYETYSKAGK